jgi:hypothetical protein
MRIAGKGKAFPAAAKPLIWRQGQRYLSGPQLSSPFVFARHFWKE